MVLALGAVAAVTAAGVVTVVEEGPPKYSIMREEAGTTRSHRPSRWAVDVPAIAMSPTSRRFLLLLGVVPGALPGEEEEEEEDADDDEEELADTVGLLLVDRGRRRRDRRLEEEEEDDGDDDAAAGPGALGLRKDGAAGKPLRMFALCMLSVGGVGRGCGCGVVVATHPSYLATRPLEISSQISGTLRSERLNSSQEEEPLQA